MEPGGRRRSGLYTYIPVPVLQVPAGKEGGPGGIPNHLNEEAKEEDDEEKNEDDENKEETEGKRRDEEEMQDSLVVEEGMMFNFPLVPLPLVSFPCSSRFKVLSVKKKLNNHIIEMHNDLTSCTLFKNTFKRRTSLSGTALCTSHHHTPARPLEMPLGDKRASPGTRSPATCRLDLLAGPVKPLWEIFFKKVQLVLTHIGGPWSWPSLQNTARQIPGQVDGTQEDQLHHLIHHLQDEVQLQGAHEKCRSSASTWICRC